MRDEQLAALLFFIWLLFMGMLFFGLIQRTSPSYEERSNYQEVRVRCGGLVYRALQYQDQWIFRDLALKKPVIVSKDCTVRPITE